jgi:hypothetical protein
MTSINNHTISSIKECRDIAENIGLKAKEKRKLVCPSRGIHMSYANDKNREILFTLNGYGVKNKGDMNIWIKRADKISGMNDTEKFMIKDIKDDGYHGNEEREVSSFFVCLGTLKKSIKIVEKRCPKCKKLYKKETLFLEYCEKCNTKLDYNKVISVYERCNNKTGDICKYLNKDKIILFTCEKCNHIFDFNNCIKNDGLVIKKCPKCSCVDVKVQNKYSKVCQCKPIDFIDERYFVKSKEGDVKNELQRNDRRGI